MATTVRSSFRLSERGIQRLLRGDIGDFAEDISRTAYVRARRRVPQGSGALFRGIRDEGVEYDRSGVTGTVSCTAPHVGYVIYGTGGASAIHGSGRGENYPIGAAMVQRGVPFGNVNRSPGRVGRRPHRMFSNQFRGQDPNNFLAEALQVALNRQGIFARVRTDFS